MIKDIYAKQLTFFNSNITKDTTFRIAQLQKLKKVLIENEALMYDAIQKDFGKSEFETYVSELSLVYHEINLCIKKTKKWSKAKRVTTGLANFPAKSYIIPEPLGTVLVIGAWNYPYQLSLVPAISALAAGNTVILKPSELPANTSYVLAKIINNNFDSSYFQVIEGGIPETTALLDLKFDKIFFTGSIPVGRIIYKAAAKHLTPVTLELGGKSPTFVLADCDINMTVKRIVWAKFLNAGQTCIAPDYILVDKAIETQLLKALKDEIKKVYTNASVDDEHYVQIINNTNYDRLVHLIDKGKIYTGGEFNPDDRYISPTILHQVRFDDKVMEDEIFGPILPVISFTALEKVIDQVKKQPKPLACYIYSKNRKNIKKILNKVSFGGGAVNDSVMHISNSKLPFGGVGFSGMGSYHGKIGFNTFTHFKSILDKPFWFEAPIKYPPYSKLKMNIIKWLLT